MEHLALFPGLPGDQQWQVDWWHWWQVFDHPPPVLYPTKQKSNIESITSSFIPPSAPSQRVISMFCCSSNLCHPGRWIILSHREVRDTIRRREPRARRKEQGAGSREHGKREQEDGSREKGEEQDVGGKYQGIREQGAMKREQRAGSEELEYKSREKEWCCQGDGSNGGGSIQQGISELQIVSTCGTGSSK